MAEYNEVEVLKNAVKRATHALVEEYYSMPSEKGYKTPEAQRCHEWLERNRNVDFSGHRVAVVSLMSALAGETIFDPVVSRGRVIDFSRHHLVAVVPLSNTNSHDYPLGQPSVMQGAASEGVRPNGTHGNTIMSGINDLRPATDEEIDAFFAENTRAVATLIRSQAPLLALVRNMWEQAQVAGETVEATPEPQAEKV